MSDNIFNPLTIGGIPISFYVECSHGTNETKYRVSYGVERWDENTEERVIKVQIVNEKGIQGLKVPSIPLKDMENVLKALEKVKVLAEFYEEHL